MDLNREKTIFWGLLGILLLCTGLYMYCIMATVHNVVARQNLESQATSLSLSVGQDEFRYITMKNNVTLAAAYALGFKDIAEKTFVSKPTLSYAASGQENL